MAGYSAVLRGAARVFVVDRVPERLRAAEAIGCIPIDFTECDTASNLQPGSVMSRPTIGISGTLL